MREIRIFYSPLTKRFYATQHYKQNGTTIEVKGRVKYERT